MTQRKKSEPRKRRYSKPALQKRRQLTDVTEARSVFVTGGGEVP